MIWISVAGLLITCVVAVHNWRHPSAQVHPVSRAVAATARTVSSMKDHRPVKHFIEKHRRK